MYEKQFGLRRRPFRANATGSDVFVGPQTAKFMAAMKKGLAVGDAVVAVTGEPGVGKTTLVNRAMDAIGGDKLIIRVARMQLGHDEVLEFLLEQLNAKELPKSTIKKINLFRDLLAARTSAGTRVIVIIEDAVRIGEDALAEFESLSAADNSAGANVILMGDDALLNVLNAPALLRLKQRTRLRCPVVPLSAGELMAYMKHCFRNAGAEFDLLFENNAAQMLFDLSNGNPRVANNLVESILTATAEQNAGRVDNLLIARVARDEFGLTVNMQEPVAEVAPSPEAIVTPEPEPEAEPEPEPTPEPELAQNTGAAPALTQDTLPDLAVLAPELVTPERVTSPEAVETVAASKAVEDDIPTLSDSMRLPEPDAVAVPELSAQAEPELISRPEPVAAPQADAIPELSLESEPDAPPVPEAAPTPDVEPVGEAQPKPQTETQSEPQAVADWDRDPTLAELRPDIEALEQAMADFQVPADVVDDVAPEPVPEVILKDPTLPGVPEITLDVAIEQKISEAQEALDKTDGMIPDSAAPEKLASPEKPEPKVGVPPLVNPPPAEEKQKVDTHIKKIVRGIAAAKSIDDVDDQMAETLFGAEFSKIAEEVVASAPELATAPESESAPELELVAEEPTAASLPADQASPAAAEPASASAMEKEFKQVYGEDALEVSIETNAGGGLDISASQRLATVRALNAEKTAPAAPAVNGATAPESAATPPEPIEDQIGTSMTATLKALGTRPASSIITDDNDNDDDDDNSKRGFFSRFKRS